MGLTLIYLLDVGISAYVPFPDSQSESELRRLSLHQTLIVGHIVLGIIVFLGSLALVAMAQKA